MALWCSRLARQPVTLEVDGSSPFGVAIKKSPPFGGLFFMLSKKRTRKPALGNLPVAGHNRRGFSAEKRVRSGFSAQAKNGLKRFKGLFTFMYVFLDEHKKLFRGFLITKVIYHHELNGSCFQRHIYGNFFLFFLFCLYRKCNYLLY